MPSHYIITDTELGDLLESRVVSRTLVAVAFGAGLLIGLTLGALT